MMMIGTALFVKIVGSVRGNWEGAFPVGAMWGLSLLCDLIITVGIVVMWGP